MKSEEDKVLSELRAKIDPIMARVDSDLTSERAVLIVGVTEIVNSNGESDGTQTYVDSVGELGLLQEALYDTFIEQITNGNMQLFESLRQVIKAVEEDLDIDPNESLVNPSESRTLH